MSVMLVLLGATGFARDSSSWKTQAFTGTWSMSSDLPVAALLPRA